MALILANYFRNRRILVVVLFLLTLPVIFQVKNLKGKYQHFKKSSGFLIGLDRPDSPSRLLTKYEFVAFKQKSGWHFKFPATYDCPKQGVSFSLRHSENASDIDGANMVFFSTGPFALTEWETLRKHRTPGQIWIFATQEPASIVPDFLPPKVYRHDTYNWSYTFHSSSYVKGPYGWYTPYPASALSSDHQTSSENRFAKRKKYAAWVSSRHCGGLGWDRTKFVKDLGQFIPIDMYGTCGNLTLKKNREIAKGVFRNYKFHLSLENSCCSEYLTEKVWNALEMWQSVPIVLGGTKEEYERLMPPHSYIHADNFSSLADLASYIKKVGDSEELYNQYFHWRRTGTVHQQSYQYRHPVFREGGCKVVEKLEELERSNTNVVHSFDPYGPKWFGSCYRCGENAWIQDYNFWWRRTIFAKEWEDNRTLYWLDKTN